MYTLFKTCETSESASLDLEPQSCRPCLSESLQLDFEHRSFRTYLPFQYSALCMTTFGNLRKEQKPQTLEPRVN